MFHLAVRPCWPYRQMVVQIFAPSALETGVGSPIQSHLRGRRALFLWGGGGLKSRPCFFCIGIVNHECGGNVIVFCSPLMKWYRCSLTSPRESFFPTSLLMYFQRKSLEKQIVPPVFFNSPVFVTTIHFNPCLIFFSPTNVSGPCIIIDVHDGFTHFCEVKGTSKRLVPASQRGQFQTEVSYKLRNAIKLGYIRWWYKVTLEC